jgi:3-hydroxyacyl-[acyl-carrier-protein] dehydratase
MKLFFVFIAALLGATTTVTLTSAKEASAPSRRLQSRRQLRASRDSSDAEAKAGAMADDMSMPSGAEITVTGAEAEDNKVKGTKGGKATDKFRGAAEISALTSSVKTIFSPEDINGILPHRYPFLLVDKVVEYEQGKRAVGIKSVTLNEPHFTGHFPDRPMMPGVLRVEALAQLAGIVCLQMEGVKPGAVFFFAGVDGVKWKKPVVPGDTLVMEVEIKKWISRFGIAKAIGRAYVDGEMAVELDEMTFAIAK